jgi:large subunit ribosomal protein L6
MSRLGKKPILIPEKVKVSITDEEIKVEGPKGVMIKKLPDDLNFVIEEDKIKISPKVQRKNISALWGLWASLVKNMILGVTEGFEKKLEIQGVGYRASVEGKNLKLEVGYTKPVLMEIPEGIEVKVEKNIITISGVDKEKVSQFAANVRKVREPDPYKGKGIRYFGEVIKLKPGKKAVASK